MNAAMSGQSGRLLKLALRDAVIALAVVALWLYILRLGSAAGFWPVAVNVLTGLFTVVAGYLVHEWGHLAGAAWSASVVELPATPIDSPFLFRFNTVQNSREQFCAMSLGGFVASILLVAALLLWLPHGLLATYIALSLVALGVGATLVIEVPGFWRVWRGAPMPSGAAFVTDPPDKG
jgi:hypothetical protein